MQTVSSSIPAAIFTEAEVIDKPVAWHYGDPFAEQRKLAAGEGTVDLSHFGVIELTGNDRLEYLHALTTNHMTRLQPGESTLTLDLSNQGFLLNELHVIHEADSTYVICQPGAVEALKTYLLKMRFRMQVEVADKTEELAVLWQPVWQNHEQYPTWLVPAAYNFKGREILVPRSEAVAIVESNPAGFWALNALRVGAKVARQNFETDHHTIPMEAGWLEGAIHMNKGCYRGQETVSKVVRMGQPPRRLELLLLSGEEELPAVGTPVMLEDKAVGFVGTSVQHYELGPVALALVKRSVDSTATLSINNQPASMMENA